MPNACDELGEAHQWFLILRTIESARPFERDELEAYYSDTMKRFIHFAVTIEWTMDFQIADIPLIAQQDSVL